MKYTDINAKKWDEWSKEKWIWTVPITQDQYQEALNGSIKVYLTPQIPVPEEWFSNIRNKKILGLASGGGQQGPIFAANGADVTILDYSDAQLNAERIVAEREGYQINLVKADMSERLPFDDETFDMIFHPVSNTYIQDIMPLWKECYRVLKKGGHLLAGFTNPDIYLFDEELKVVNRLPYDPLANFNEEERQEVIKNEGLQFSHSFETQIGGQLKAGFKLVDLYEDKGTDDLSNYMSTFIATRAEK
ncbi:class I SAM-dependent methyltransferase [Scopulibacillus cellulosilyticus]|uniref:Class I SAM-dependent methyltransferase n=1 Tax=Scopulibacillus cellulosilyticus TaxID=2665665 RepID=A0ABW2Q2W8_9BACL